MEDIKAIVTLFKKIKKYFVDSSREKSFDELLPWDFIDHGINKSFLNKEYQKALLQKTSAPCPITSCNKCGVCIYK